ncbi:glycoside hydrolase family 19 protein [Psychrobacter sanguinis]|uniref:glycoside hydrolase family 19 protein n=1 Tax=Psychrobacter sanguinis TaxID=861445 RepID=UPI00191AEFAF|nr:glycoside hydrolase family 19 protein [Psychrobacter sanguinis]MCC3344498.1 hypothetical protein [Psychrobacter sanguinis]
MTPKDSNKRLQRIVGVLDDGYWGDTSQKALIASKKKLGFIHGKLSTNFGRLRQSQVNGFDSVLSACNAYGGDAINPVYVAYMLATCWHETAATMQPISEYGKGSTRRYGKWYKNSKGALYGFANGEGKTYLKSDYPYLYYGRGDVQLTWLDNYLKMGKIIGVDLANNPDLANKQEYASKIMIKGMLMGVFTGLSLSDCIHYGLELEFKKARKIINGTDKDTLIAGYAIQFLDCLTLIK